MNQNDWRSTADIREYDNERRVDLVDNSEYKCVCTYIDRASCKIKKECKSKYKIKEN